MLTWAKLTGFRARRGKKKHAATHYGALTGEAHLSNAASDRSKGDERPSVVIWKNSWLSPSETFVRDQVAAMDRWRPVLFGLNVLPDGLPMPVTRAPFPASRPGRVARKVLAKVGYAGIFDGPAKRLGVRLIHAHFAGGGIAASPLAKHLRVPLLVTFHGKDVTGDPLLPGLVGRRYRKNLRQLFQDAALLIAVSEHIRRRLVELGAPEEKIRVHRIGVPLREAPQSTDRSGIVFVGRLVEKKGVSDLLAAVGRLPVELRETVPVTIVGFGPLEARLRDEALRLGLPHVRFLGRLGSAEVAERLASALVFCAPSKTAADGDTEGLPISLLEAALQGAGVVSTAHAGIPEFVTDGVSGLLSPEGDVAGLSANLERMLTDDAFRVGAVESLRERLYSQYDIARQTAVLESLYDRIVNGDGK